MKKLTSIALAAAMLTSAGATAFAAEQAFPFRDVPEAAWYYEYVQKAYSNGIMVGTGGMTFAPNDTMTREMFVTALANVAGAKPSHDKVSAFADVKPAKWYTPYIAWAQENNIVKGIDEKNFSLGQAVTREQMAVMLSNFANMADGPSLLESTVQAPAFQDSSTIASWAKDAVEQMRLCGIFSGDRNNRFLPKQAATRAECAAVLTRFKQARVDCGDLHLGFDKLTMIRLRSCANGLPVYDTISDQAEMQQLLDYINAAPVTSKKYSPPASGWMYGIEFWNGKAELNWAGFGADWILIDNVRYYTEGEYFLPLMQKINADGKVIPLD